MEFEFNEELVVVGKYGIEIDYELKEIGYVLVDFIELYL